MRIIDNQKSSGTPQGRKQIMGAKQKPSARTQQACPHPGMRESPFPVVSKV